MRRREEKIPLGRPKLRWEDNIKMDLEEVRWGPDLSGSGWRQVAGACERGNESSGSVKRG